jgi:hypothetical protein
MRTRRRGSGRYFQSQRRRTRSGTSTMLPHKSTFQIVNPSPCSLLQIPNFPNPCRAEAAAFLGLVPQRTFLILILLYAPLFFEFVKLEILISCAHLVVKLDALRRTNSAVYTGVREHEFFCYFLWNYGTA